MAQLSPNPHQPTEPNVSFEDFSLEGMRRADKYVQDLIDKMQQKDPDDPNCDIRGVILSFPRGDGAAYYIVSKVRPLTVEHIPVCDAWRAYPEDLVLRGINKAYIMDILRMEKRMRGALGVRQRGWAPGN
jgi:hypothetical protein